MPAICGRWIPGGGDKVFNFFWLSISLGVRLCAGLGTTVLIARALTPSGFGIVALGLTWGTVIGFFADLGGGVSTLRVVGANPDKADVALSAACSAKATNLLLSTPIALASAFALTAGFENFAAFVLAYVSACFLSMSDLCYVAFRATSKNFEELIASVASNAAWLVITFGVLLFENRILYVSLVVLLSRVVSSALVFVFADRLGGVRVSVSFLGWSQLKAYFEGAREWALSANLGYINSQIDNFAVGPLLGSHANGLYQSVSRFLTVAAQVPAIAINFWAPRIALHRESGRSGSRLKWTGAAAIIGAGLAVALGFKYVGPLMTARLLPAAYANASVLWGPVALLALARSCSIALNLWFIADNRPLDRAVAEGSALVCNIGGLLIFAPKLGVIAVPYILSAGSMVTVVVGVLSIMARDSRLERVVFSLFNALQSIEFFHHRIRRAVLILGGAKISKSAVIFGGNFFGSSRLTVGDNVFINRGGFYDGNAHITIADSSRVGPHVKILTRTHPIEPSVIRRKVGEDIDLPVTIERGCWIGIGVTILPGVTIAEGCVIGAGAVVTKSTEPNGLYVGNPATRKRDLPTS